MLPLPTDETDPRLIIRLVRMFPGGSGELVADRNAAAAAADERAGDGFPFARFTNAAVAATEALLLVDPLTGCRTC